MAYRLNNGSNGEALSWLNLTQDILDCPATKLSLPEEEREFTAEDFAETEVAEADQKKYKIDEDWPLRSEALRRFVEEETGEPGKEHSMRKDRVEAVRDFLFHVKYLYPAELAEPEIIFASAYSQAELYASKGLALSGSMAWQRELVFRTSDAALHSERALAIFYPVQSKILRGIR